MIVAYALKRIGEFDIRKPGGHVEHIAEDVVYVAAIAPCTVAISTATKHFFMKFLSTTLLMVIRVDIIQKILPRMQVGIKRINPPISIPLG